MGGDESVGNVTSRSKVFQSAPPHGGRPPYRRRSPWSGCFNPRPRMGGDSMRGPPRAATRCFNPRPRMGGDIPLEGSGIWRPVSIRAPAWGATFRAYKMTADGVFQSAPPHGGRRKYSSASAAVKVFQSAPPHGGRQIWRQAGVFAPLFQSAPPHGGRLTLCGALGTEFLFQSAPPHGGRPAPRRPSPVAPCFNPRPRMGGDM